jgi:ABC-2 type transport system permease protein
MLRNIFFKTLRDQAMAVVGWGLGVGSLAIFTQLFYPSLSANRQLENFMGSLPQGFMAFFGNVQAVGSVEGYMTYTLLVYLPLVLCIYSIGAATEMVTAEVEKGTMEFLLSHPLPRWRILLEKYAALSAAVLAIGLQIGLCMVIGGLLIQSDVPAVHWMLAGIQTVPITLFFGSVAFGLACAVRGSATASGTAATLAVGGFILNGLIPLSDKLAPVKEWTLYYWYSASQPLSAGILPGHAAILILGSLLFLGMGLAAFQQRDILP